MDHNSKSRGGGGWHCRAAHIIIIIPDVVAGHVAVRQANAAPIPVQTTTILPTRGSAATAQSKKPRHSVPPPPVRGPWTTAAAVDREGSDGRRRTSLAWLPVTLLCNKVMLLLVSPYRPPPDCRQGAAPPPRAKQNAERHSLPTIAFPQAADHSNSSRSKGADAGRRTPQYTPSHFEILRVALLRRSVVRFVVTTLLPRTKIPPPQHVCAPNQSERVFNTTWAAAA